MKKKGGLRFAKSIPHSLEKKTWFQTINFFNKKVFFRSQKVNIFNKKFHSIQDIRAKIKKNK